MIWKRLQIYFTQDQTLMIIIFENTSLVFEK